MPSRAYSVTTALDNYTESHTRYGTSAGKVRYDTLLDLRDFGYELTFKNIRVRSLGVKDTPREIAERKRDDFNARYPIGTPVRVYPGAMGDHERAYDTTVMEPGAFIMGGRLGTQVSVKVPGDSIAITHVVPLVPLESGIPGHVNGSRVEG